MAGKALVGCHAVASFVAAPGKTYLPVIINYNNQEALTAQYAKRSVILSAELYGSTHNKSLFIPDD